MKHLGRISGHCSHADDVAESLGKNVFAMRERFVSAEGFGFDQVVDVRERFT
jgi:hypothetical protein